MISRASLLAAAATCAVVAGLAVASPAVAADSSGGATVTPTTTLNGYRNVGYYGAWQATGDAKATLTELFVDRPTGKNITHLNYAFGNIAGSQDALDAARDAGAQGLDGVDPGTCFISDDAGAGAGQTDAAGDADDDFVRAYDAEDAVLGVADTDTQKLAGNFNQLRELKQLYPDLKVSISLGGWSWSKSFSTAVATPDSRAKLASSCIDLYIKGNLPTIDGRGGDGAAAGIFDGIDIDWEWPGAPEWAQQAGNSIDPESDAANMLAFVKELRTQLDALTEKTGKDYELSAFLPASPTVITAGGWSAPELFEYLDYGNLQGYDLWGTWSATTGHQANIVGDPNENWGLGLDTIVASYEDAGVDLAQLNLGVPSYGQGWKDAQAQPWTPASGIGQQSWDQLKKRNLEIHHDYTADGQFDATWGYDPEAQEFWSFDDTFSVAAKTRWAIDQGLGGVDFWELSQDLDGDLSAASASVMRKADEGPVAGTEMLRCQRVRDAGAKAWNAQTTYQRGDRAYFDGHVYEALWYTKGRQPGTSAVGPWSTYTACGVDPDTVQAWADDQVYHRGDQVTLAGDTYTAKWWTRNQKPGDRWGPWQAE